MMTEKESPVRVFLEEVEACLQEAYEQYGAVKFTSKDLMAWRNIEGISRRGVSRCLELLGMRKYGTFKGYNIYYLGDVVENRTYPTPARTVRAARWRNPSLELRAGSDAYEFCISQNINEILCVHLEDLNKNDGRP